MQCFSYNSAGPYRPEREATKPVSREPRLHPLLFSLWGSRGLGRASERGSWHITAACGRTTQDAASVWRVCSVTTPEPLVSAPDSTCLGSLCLLSSVGPHHRLRLNTPCSSGSQPLRCVLLAVTSSHFSGLIKTTASLCFLVSLLLILYVTSDGSLLYGPQFPHLRKEGYGLDQDVHKSL